MLEKCKTLFGVGIQPPFFGMTPLWFRFALGTKIMYVHELSHVFIDSIYASHYVEERVQWP